MTDAIDDIGFISFSGNIDCCTIIVQRWDGFLKHAMRLVLSKRDNDEYNLENMCKAKSFDALECTLTCWVDYGACGCNLDHIFIGAVQVTCLSLSGRHP